MVITYNGLLSFKVQLGDVTLAFNPVGKDSKSKSVRFGADVAFVSLQHPDTNGIESVTFGEKQPFVVSGPGEYETKNIFIKGFESHSSYGGKDKINTIYTLSLDNMNLCFLGALDTPELKKETLEALDEIDILFVPIGGNGVLDSAKAYKLAVSLEPKIIIPMHVDGAKDALKTFLKEGGQNPDALDKLTVKRKDIEGKEGEIVVLSPQS